MNANEVSYYLIITYPHSRNQVLLAGDGGRAIAATEENKDVLLGLGKRLLDENIIASYQLLNVAGDEVNNLGVKDE